VNGFHADRILEHLEVQMRDVADAGGCVVHFLRHRPRVRHEFRDRRGRDVVCNDQCRWGGRDRGDSIVLPERIETSCLAIQRLTHAERIFRKQKRVPIGFGGGDVRPGNIAARARPIFHDDGLAERLFEVVGNLSRQRVGCAAGHECHDQANRARWIGLRLREPRHGREGSRHGSHTQECAARKFHDVLPGSLCRAPRACADYRCS
jgi:hypothetical protein